MMDCKGNLSRRHRRPGMDGWMAGCNRDNVACDVCTAYVSASACTSKHPCVKTKFSLTCQALEIVAHKSGNMLLSRKLPGGQSSRRRTSMRSLHSSLFKKVRHCRSGRLFYWLLPRTFSAVKPCVFWKARISIFWQELPAGNHHIFFCHQPAHRGKIKLWIQPKIAAAAVKCEGSTALETPNFV